MKKDKERNKVAFIILRVTATEKDYLQKTARKENKNVSKLVRGLLGFE
ncbi:MAG: hypothetical protein ABIQ91_03935 [Candidatus Paceibacterota bacterium]